MAGFVKRHIHQTVLRHLKQWPVVALLGPRQVGKSTLAKKLMAGLKKTLYLDLERPSHLRKLDAPEYFLTQNRGSLICLDEVQRLPEIFPLLRSLVDDTSRCGQFLILGSASKELLKQSSESLAGRISYLEMTPLTLTELHQNKQELLWLRGGFPKSFLSSTDKTSREWRENYIRSFLESDIPQMGLKMPAHSVGRLWSMLAFSHGQTLNSSKLATSMGISSHTVNRYISILEKTFLVRRLPPFFLNLKKRVVKAPKIYIRDSGILHSLLKVDSINDLFGHPVFGSSFEGFVIENIISHLPGWQFYFYRTRSGAEIDLLMIRGRRKVAVEIKASKAPVLKPGFWTAIKDVEADEKYVIAPVEKTYPLKGNVTVCSLTRFLNQNA